MMHQTHVFVFFSDVSTDLIFHWPQNSGGAKWLKRAFPQVSV
jgi:hypothetical protein